MDSGWFTFTNRRHQRLMFPSRIASVLGKGALENNYSLTFDGSDDYVEASFGVEFGTGEWSVSFWVKPLSGSGIAEYIFSMYNDTSGTNRWGYRKDGQIYAPWIGGDGFIISNADGAIDLVDDVWTHVAIVHNGNITVYQNGDEAYSNADTSNYTVTENYVRFGHSASGTTAAHYFQGIINEVSIWGSALTLGEIQAIFNDGVALDVSSDSGDYASSDDLVGYWRNDGASTWSNKVLTSNVVTINEGAEYSDSDVTLTVNNGALVSVNDVLVIDNEELLVTSISTHNLTVTRGYNGTTATAHDNGANISVYHNGTINGSPDTILLPEGTTSGKDILGFPLTAPNNGWLNLSGSEYVLPQSSSVFDVSHAFSLEVWAKNDLTDVSGSVVNHIFSRYSGSSGNRIWALHYKGVSVNFTCSEDGTLDAGQFKTLSSSSLTFSDWNHLVCTFDNGVMTIFKNGASLATSDESANFVSVHVNSARAIEIGSYSGGYGNWNGSLDEVKFYNRALEQAEITKNYKHGLSKHS